MRRIVTGLVAAIALAACASSSTQGAGPTAPQAGALTIAPLAYTLRTLPNGLRVYAMPDPNTANVAVHVWYDVGSRDDPEGRSGFAHLFEHIMFKATRNMPAETLDRLTEDVGGNNNASTWDDFTNYYQVVPANHLEGVLWAEAERMGSLVIDEATFAAERDVVKEEFRQGILANPYGRLLGLYLAQTRFSRHPYGRPTIGSIEDLDAATVADVRAFHATYYRPDNAILVVSGNFSEADLNRWVDQYFGPIARPNREIPRVTVSEPRAPGPRDYTVYEQNVPLPAVAITYPGFEARHPDRAAFLVLDGVLSAGDSSRLHQALVYEQQVASEVFAFSEATRQAHTYAVGAVLSEGRTAEAGLASLNAEIARLRDAPISAAELREAQNEIVMAALNDRETAFGRASALADSVTRYRDPEYGDQLLAQVQRVTPADVQRVARALFDDTQRVTIRYLAEESRPAGAPEDAITTAPTIQAQRLTIAQSDIPVFALAPEAARVRAPAPGPDVAARIPAAHERTLANGLRVIVAQQSALPILSAQVRVLSGASSDAAGRAGLASLTADLVTEGTASRSATEIARAIESLGASLEAEAGADSSAVSLRARADRADEAFAVFADVIRAPAFAAEELERRRQQALDGLSIELAAPRSLARMVMARAIYGAGPYGGTPSPTTLAAITRSDIADFHRAHWRPDNAVLVITGDVSAEDGFALAQRWFGDWARPATPSPAEPDASLSAPETRAIVVDLDGAGQAAVSFGVRGVSRTDGDYFPTLVASTVLGGGYSARLNYEIRIRRGLSYGAGASFAPRLAPGPIIAVAQTRNDAAEQVMALMEAEFVRLGDEAVPPAELRARRASLIGGFGRDVETTAGLAGQLAQLALFNAPLSQLNTYVSDVAAVTPAQLQAAADRLFDPRRADLVIVGDADIFYDAVRRRRANVERISSDALNLDRAALR